MTSRALKGLLSYLWRGVGSCLTQGDEDFEQGTRGHLVSTDSSAQLCHALLDVASQGFLHNLVHLLCIGLKVIVDLKIGKRNI